MSGYILELKKISKSFSGVEVLHEASFVLRPGEITAEAGQSFEAGRLGEYTIEDGHDLRLNCRRCGYALAEFMSSFMDASARPDETFVELEEYFHLD